MRVVTMGVAGLTCASLLFVSCAKNEKAETPPSEEGQSPSVPVARVERRDLSRDEVLTAEFRPFQEIDVHAKVAGYVKKIYVDVGDRVKEGQTLAVLEVPELTDEMARAEATHSRSATEVQRQKEEVARAQAAYDATHLTYTRLAGVAKTRPNLIAQQEIDDARARDDVAAAQVSAAKAALATAQEEVRVSQADVRKTSTMNAYANITAPFAGVITHRYADTGAMIPAGTSQSANALPLVKLSQNYLLRLTLPVPETIASRVHPGQQVEVRVPSLGRSFAGKVTRFADVVTMQTRTMDTEIDVPNPTLALIPGMYAEAVLVTDRRTNALAAPIAAVATENNHNTVYRIGPGNKVEVRTVKIGLETPDWVEIVSGLEENDLVVTGNRGALASGEVVEPKPAEKGSK